LDDFLLRHHEKHVKPLISILIPAYNAEKRLAETLRSAIAQTWDHKEIIVVDDGSDDRTLSLARSFESKTVRVFTQDHQGAAAARNRAFAESHGDYIQWLDADDLLKSDKIALQVQAVGVSPNPRILLSGEWARFLHRPIVAKFNPSDLWCDLRGVEWLMRKMEQNVFMQTATWLVSRELTEAAGPWDSRLLSDDDGEYFCRVLMASEGIRFVPGSRVYYRQLRSGSLGYIGRCNVKRDAMWLSMKLHIGYLRSMDDGPRARAACVAYLQNCVALFYPERPDLIALAQGLADELGGRLETPHLPRKYSWVSELFGAHIAWQMQRDLSGMKWWLFGTWDRFLKDLSAPAHDHASAAINSRSVNINRTRSNGIPMRSSH
jgi:glycosyltransferase involved in cell wall biosynthesis